MRQHIPTLSAFALSALFALAAAATSTVVEIAAPDGIKLAATYTSPGKPGPGILLLHMCNSDRSAWKGLAEKLAEQGIHSLALDYRGYGDSGGERLGGQIRDATWAGDVDAAFDFLRSKPGVDGGRIGAAGGSCGVDESVSLAQRHPGEVQALALLAGGTDSAGSAFLAENPWLPVLASASRDDGQAVETMRWLIGFSSHPANRFLEYPHGGHGTEMFAVHDDLEPAIADWLAEHLVKHPATRPATVVAKPGPSVRLWEELLAPGGVERVAVRLRAAKAKGETAPMPPESAINAEGYRRITAGEAQQAIEILAFSVEAFPQSANTLDSLGDAYLAAGQPEKASELARRTLEAIPNDPNITEDFARTLREAAEGKLAAQPPADGG